MQEAWRRTAIIGLVGGTLTVLLAVAQFVWRYEYYGALLPNTYTLKMVGYSLDLRLSNGIGFLSIFLSSYWPVIVAAVVVLIFFPHHRLLGAVFFASFLIAALYQIYVGGDPWVYWRQLVPGLVLLYIGLAINVGGILKLLPEDMWPAMFLVIICATLIVCGVTNIPFASEIVGRTPPYQANHNKTNIAVAIALRDLLAPDAKVSSFWAGTIPYYWNGPAIDPLGKTDSFIARLPVDRRIARNGMNGVPGHAKYDFNHSVVQGRPDYLGGERSVYWYPTFTPEINKQYVRADYNGVSLCLRKGSPNVNWSKVEVIGPCA
jgi:hypothetical protein